MKIIHCPCGSNKAYTVCCGQYLDSKATPATAEALMRSRYTAYTLLREDYLLSTWHASTRPETLNLKEQAKVKWLGLQIKRYEQQDACHATVEFVARNREFGIGIRLHEVSRFVREDGRWFYVDGEVSQGDTDQAYII